MKKRIFLFLITAILFALPILATEEYYTLTITIAAGQGTWGTVTGGGIYKNGATAMIAAVPAQGYQFSKWSDGSNENPRSVVVTQDSTITAIFQELLVCDNIRASGTCGANLTWELCTNGTLFIYGTGEMENYAWQDAPWYGYASQIMRIVLPEGITVIGLNAFGACQNVESIVIPTSVQKVGGMAFYGCSSLKTVYWNAKSVSTPIHYFEYPDHPFESYSDEDKAPITTIIFGEQVERIPAYMCYNMTTLTNVTFPNSISIVEPYAFQGCTGLKEPVYNDKVFAYMPSSYKGDYTVPDGIVSIAGGAFDGCSSITSVKLPESVTEVGYEAFEACTGLTSPIYNSTVFARYPISNSGAYTIQEGTRSIGSSAFANATLLTTISIPNSVEEIGAEAFYYCEALLALDLPDGLVSVGSRAFMECNKIKDVVFGKHLTDIGERLFSGCDELNTITFKANTPPSLIETLPVYYFDDPDSEWNSTLGNKTCPVYVPCGSIESYKEALPKHASQIVCTGGGGEGGEGGNEPPTGAIPLDMDAILIDYFPSYSSAIGYDYSLYMYKNDKSAGYMPELVLDIQTPTHKDFVGEYSIAKGNMELDYCGLYLSADNEKSYELFGLTDVYCQISLADGQYTVTGYVTASDEKSYSFNVIAEAYFEDAEHLYEPETPQILDIAIQSADINLESIERGVMRVTFDTSDEEWISFLFVTKDTESTTLPDGVYNITTNSYESFLAGYSRSDSYYNSLAKIGGNMYYLTEGTVIVKSISKGKYFDVEATSFYGTKFKFSYLIADGDSDGILTISVAQALDLAASLDENEIGQTPYHIIGYVTYIQYNSFNTSSNDMTFWIADTNNGASSNEGGGFCVYRGVPDVELKEGDKVQVTTCLKNYYGQIESETKAPVILLEREDYPTPDVTKYTISVAANDSRLGTVKGGGTYNQGTQITLTASANKGARFDKWSDGVTTATRTITVSSNTTYTAIFKAVTSSNAGKLADGYNQYDEKSGVAEPAKEPKRIPVATTTQKIIHDGHIYILIEGHVYDAQGRKIK
ncbi:MAG: leucine-rich repeat protein [Paludibacteraceae bacterium]|nr:leucine-rich repeat protein [Paludibacteraceae bacterium]